MNYYNFPLQYIEDFVGYCESQLLKKDKKILYFQKFISNLKRQDFHFKPIFKIDNNPFMNNGISFFNNVSGRYFFPRDYEKLRKIANSLVWNYYELAKQANNIYAWAWFIIFLNHTDFFDSFDVPQDIKILKLIQPFFLGSKDFFNKYVEKTYGNDSDELSLDLEKNNITIFNKDNYLKWPRKINVFYPKKGENINHIYLNPNNELKNRKNAFNYEIKSLNRKIIYILFIEIFLFIKEEYDVITIPSFDNLKDSMHNRDYLSWIILVLINIFLKNKKIKWENTKGFIYHLYNKFKKRRAYILGDLFQLWKIVKNY